MIQSTFLMLHGWQSCCGIAQIFWQTFHMIFPTKNLAGLSKALKKAGASKAKKAAFGFFFDQKCQQLTWLAGWLSSYSNSFSLYS